MEPPVLKTGFLQCEQDQDESRFFPVIIWAQGIYGFITRTGFAVCLLSTKSKTVLLVELE